MPLNLKDNDCSVNNGETDRGSKDIVAVAFERNL